MLNKLFSQKTIFYFLSVVVFLLVLHFSTNIVLVFRGLYIEKLQSNNIQIDNIEFNKIPEANISITYQIYNCIISDNVDGEVEISGYAYMETEQNNSDKRIDLLLASSDDTYLVPTKLSARHDLSAERTGKLIQGTNHSFSGRFSYFLLPDGIYRVILYCYENDSTYDYVYTDMLFSKQDKSFKIVVLPSIELASKRIDENRGVDLSDLDSIVSNPLPWHYLNFEKQDDEYLAFNGWIAVPALDSRQAQSFISFTDKAGSTTTFSTTSYESKGLEEIVGTSNVNHGFFKAYIPLTELEPGEYIVELIVQYPDVTCKPEVSHQLSISDNRKATFVSGLA